MEDLYGPLDEKKKKAGTESSKESSLKDWFGRKGAKGSKKGWVDCNAPDGKGGYKSCGRGSGEKRKKYPACRPTPGACKERGKGKSWGKKGKSKKNEEINMDIELYRMIEEEIESVITELNSKKQEKELEKISDELAGASKMHKGQSDRIKKILDQEDEDDLKEGKKNCGCGQDPCKTYGIQENTDAEIGKEDSHEMQRVNDELLSDLQDIDMDWIMDDESMYRMLDGFKRDSKTPDEYQQKIKLFLNKNANKFGYGGLGDEVFNEELEAVLDEKRKKKKKSGKKDACYHKVKSRYKVWPSAYASGALVKCRKVGAKNWGNSKKEALEIENDNKIVAEMIDLYTFQETETFLEESLYYGLIDEDNELEEAKKKKACKPSKGKKFARRVKGRCVSYGQAGKAKGGGARIKPGTSKGNAYCARSYGDMKSHGKDCSGKDRGTPLCLSRQKWKCSGKYSRKGK